MRVEEVLKREGRILIDHLAKRSVVLSNTDDVDRTGKVRLEIPFETWCLLLRVSGTMGVEAAEAEKRTKEGGGA